jgi:hypothetical protein
MITFLKPLCLSIIIVEQCHSFTICIPNVVFILIFEIINYYNIFTLQHKFYLDRSWHQTLFRIISDSCLTIEFLYAYNDQGFQTYKCSNLILYSFINVSKISLFYDLKFWILKFELILCTLLCIIYIYIYIL